MKVAARPIRVSILALLISGGLWLGAVQFLPSSRLRQYVVGFHCESSPTPKGSATLSDVLFPLSEKPNANWPTTAVNHRALRALFQCIESSTCGPNQEKIVMTYSVHFNDQLKGHTSGEHIWAKSIVLSLHSLGYTLLYARSWEQLIQLYNMFPDMVKVIIISAEDAYECWDDKWGCLLSVDNPDGIPAWKIFTFHFWANELNPLGHKWTLSPENYTAEGYTPPLTYIGYSVEPNCLSKPFVPHENRKDEGYIQAKLLNFFTPRHDRAWPPDYFDAASEATGVQFYFGARKLPGEEDLEPELPEHAINLGMATPAVFAETLSRMKVLVGLGAPANSPTAYDGLCAGVPFINPVHSWDANDPTNRMMWNTQHNPLKFLDPPYVYNVFKGDRDVFIKAIEEAISHPIESHILERMKLTSVEQRVHEFMETDWRTEAARLLAHRRESGEGDLFML